jgi:hypothetical protein
VGLACPIDAGGSGDQGLALVVPTGFDLSPGTLEWWLGPKRASTGRPVARWTYPDGTGGCSACPGQGVLSAPGGDLLLVLPDRAASGCEETGEPGPMAWPQALLAIHGGMAYEFRMADGVKPSDCSATGFAQYRLSAVRAPSGEVISFAYGSNGVDFEASWEGEKVRVALDGMAAANAVPALDCGLRPGFLDVEARLRVTYEGPKAIPGYTVLALTRPESLTTEGPLVPDGFRQAMQVARIQEDGSGETVAFGYGNARAVSFAGPSGTQSFAPTVLQEIARPGRTIRLEWEGQPCPRPPEISGGEAPPAAWTFGVAELHDRSLDGGGAGGEDLSYRRLAPRLGNGVRQSRHFALGCNPQGATSCKTFIRDRWELGGTGTAWTDAATQDPQRRVPFDYEGDIPTFVLDPQGLTLVPVPGLLTRWLNWKDGQTDLDRPPEIHGLKPQERSRIGLLGGGDEPTAKSGEKTLGPITYNPATGEVTMEASMGPARNPPPRLDLPPAGYTGHPGAKWVRSHPEPANRPVTAEPARKRCEDGSRCGAETSRPGDGSCPGGASPAGKACPLPITSN